MNFIKDESGQGLTEYALIIMLCAVVVIAFLTKMGSVVPEYFTKVSNALVK